MNAHILVVDDEPDICELVGLLLRKRGYGVRTASSGTEALTLLQQEPVDLIILDIMMPGLSGIDACAALREWSTAPVLFLSARSQETDKDMAYRSGGDDYLTKPFSPTELIRRVEALLRRYCVYQGKNAMPAQRVYVDRTAKKAYRNGAELTLTEMEFELLAFFTEHAGQVLDNRTIYESVWHETYLAASANTVTVHILKLRKKIENDPSRPELLKTVWGKGYRFEP